MPAEPVIVLLQRARAAGITLARTPRGALTLEIPDQAAALAPVLHTREAHLLALFDWRRAQVAKPAPCLLCRRPALLRDPVDQRPAHKVCVDALLRAVPDSTEARL